MYVHTDWPLALAKATIASELSCVDLLCCQAIILWVMLPSWLLRWTFSLLTFRNILCDPTKFVDESQSGV